jgi:TatD DNase family protein
MLDTHCHIDLYPNPELILEECEKAGFPILSMTNLPSHFERGYPFFQNRNKVRQALGMHPLYAQHHKKEFPKFISNLIKTSYIGEVGLDFSKDGIGTKEIQIQTFESILNIIAGQKKLLSIHSRRAEKEVLDLLMKYRIRNAIFHWYSGPLHLVESILNEGYYLSVNAAMVKSELGRSVISKMPLGFLLTETDGPFIMEDNLPTKPGQVASIISYLGQSLQLSDNLIEQAIMLNFNKIINNLR